MPPQWAVDREQMRNGDAHSAVRVLPADGVHPESSRPPGRGGKPQRKWLVPVTVVGVALLAFLAATRPATEPNSEAATTTLAPGLSAVSTELIDLTNSSGAATTTNDWEAVPFEWPGRINDVLAFNSSQFAFGYDDDGAAAWLSSTGSHWRDVPRFEGPDNPKSSVDHAVVWNSTVVALGSVGNEVGLWTARSLSHWFYEGTVAEMGDWLPHGLAATDELLAISEKDGHYRGWMSNNGLTWTQLEDMSALDEVVVLSLVGIGDWFYATGRERSTGLGKPVIYRSRDGVTWERTDGLDDGSNPGYRGAVVDITATSEGLVAVGEAHDELAVWKSADGAAWNRVASNSAALLGTSIVVELKSISATGEALVAIDGKEYRLAEGSQVLTNVGLIELSGVGETSADIEWVDGSSDRLRIDSQPRTVQLRQSPISAIAQGPRIVMVGWVGVQSPLTPAVWTSVDGGRSWSIGYPDPGRPGWARAAAITGANITLVGGSDGETAQAWHTTWNTQRIEDDGVALVEAYFDAIEQRDVDSVIAMLPVEPDRFQIPSLAGVELPWWDETTARIDRGAVTSTLEYLEALNTRTDLGECGTRVLLAEVDSLRVSCGFEVESDLLATYSNQDHEGTAEIVVENGRIRRVRLSVVPSNHMWRMLTDGFSPDEATIQAMLDNPDTAILDPTFSAESAPVHLQAAQEFVDALLRPGDTRIVETSLGTMEWTWLEPLPIPVYYVTWITAYGDGFVAIGQGEADRWTEETTLWASRDGVTWEPMAGPRNVTGMWNLQPFRDGLIGQAWDMERSFLVHYDGSRWDELQLPSVESAPFLDVRYLATSGDTTLVVTVGWSEGYEAGPDAYQAWLIGPDNVPKQANLPIDFWQSEESIGLVGSDEGFLLATVQAGSPRSMKVWFSPDGYEWSEMAATTSIENAAYVWNLQRHNDRYFVVGEGAESNCSTTEDGNNVCQQLVGLWSSPDGADWERVFTASGEAVGAYEIGSGPLGLAAMAVDFYSDTQLPRPLYLSPDGSTWERAGNLAFMHPDAEWWWVSLPAVGTDTIVVPGSAFLPSLDTDDDIPFLIVGRVVDG